jgi:hypothetical protein
MAHYTRLFPLKAQQPGKNSSPPGAWMNKEKALGDGSKVAFHTVKEKPPE